MSILKSGVSNTTDIIIKISDDNINPMHPIGKVILDKISENNRKSPQMCLAWAERLLSKKDKGNEYLNAGSDWLGRAMLYADIDRKPNLLFNDIVRLTKKHFNQEALVTVLQRASKQCPKDNIINRRLKDESNKLAETLLENENPEAAKQTIERLIELYPESIEFHKTKTLLSQIEKYITLEPAKKEAVCSTPYNQAADINEGEVCIKALEKSVTERPENIKAHVTLANLYISQGQFDDAIRLIEDFQNSQNISGGAEIILEEILDEAYGSIEPETINHAEEQRGYQAHEIEP